MENGDFFKNEKNKNIENNNKNNEKRWNMKNNEDSWKQWNIRKQIQKTTVKHNENTLNINEHNEKTWQTHWKIMQHIETKHWNNTFNIMFDSVQQTSWTIKIRIHWLILSLSPIWGPFEVHLRLVWVSIEVVAGCSSVFVHKFEFELILREFTGFNENHWKQQKITSRPVWVSLRKFYVSPNSSSRSFRVRFEMFPGQK